jgi:hypothetical protein
MVSHYGGERCREMNERMMGNMAAAFKYAYRYEGKGAPIENLEKLNICYLDWVSY